MNLDNLTIDEINEQEIKQEEINKRQKLAHERIEYIKEHADIILPLLEHNRSSCSDEDVSNGYSEFTKYARCNKCHLLEILNGEHSDRFDVKFEVVIIDTEE